MSVLQSNPRIVAVGSIILVVISTLLTMRHVSLNSDQFATLKAEKLKTESLLAEKSQLQNEFSTLRKELKTLQGKNSDLDLLLAETQKSLEAKEARLNQINSPNKNQSKQLAELKNIRTSLEAQIASLNEELEKILHENATLRNDFETTRSALAQMEKENKTITENMGLLTAIMDDNLLLVTKRNEKLTVNSKRARKMDFIFDVPQSSLGTLEFKVVSPTDKVYSKADGSITYHVLPNEGNQVAGLGTSGNFELVQKVEMQFKPKEPMTKGVYRIDVYNLGLRIGSMQVKLR